MRNSKKIYIASPLGFTESTLSFMEKLDSSLIDLGFDVINPWKLGDPNAFEEIKRIKDEKERIEKFKELNFKIGERNEKAINESEIILAILDGVDVDSGTAAEIGYAFAKGKRIIGYRNDFRMAGENCGSIVNIQVEYWILKNEGRILNNLKELLDYLKKNIL